MTSSRVASWCATDSPQLRAENCIDWRAQRPVLGALRNNQAASWRSFDWEAFDGSKLPEEVQVAPAPVVLLEGVYSARPELADLVDISVLLRLPEELRMKQLLAREGQLSAWETQWHEAEDFFFDVAPPGRFDLVLDPH